MQKKMIRKGTIIILLGVILGAAFVPTISKGSSSNFTTYVYTVSDIVLFGYSDNTYLRIYDSSDNIVWAGTVNDGEYHHQTVYSGIYKIIGDKKFSILTGDPISSYVMGYYAIDENGNGASTKLYTYMPRSFYVDYFIVFAYRDGTQVSITNMDTGSIVWSGILNKGDHYSDATLSDNFVMVQSNYPVSALSYNDQGYFVPSANQKFSGTEFYTYADDIGGWDNTLHIMAYTDNTDIIIKNTVYGIIYWSGTLDKGEEYKITSGASRYYSIFSNKDITVAVLPINGYSSSYHHGTYVADKQGFCIGTEFFTPSLYNGHLWTFAHEDSTTVKIHNAGTGALINSYILNKGDAININPGYGYWHIVSNNLISVYEGYRHASASFAPLIYSIGETSIQFPIDGYVVNGFRFGQNVPKPGYPKRYHLGEDIIKPAGTNVYACSDGLVKVANANHPSYQGLIIIEHTLSDGTYYCSLYGHLDHSKTSVSPNTYINAGEKISELLGNPADPEYIPHLHFGIRMGAFTSEYALDPYTTSGWYWGGYGLVHPESKTNWWVKPSKFIKDHSLSSISVSRGCPVELRVYDIQGQITGEENGELKAEITNSAYVNGTVIILNPTDQYIYEIYGTGEGSYNLEIIRIIGLDKITFNASGIPIILEGAHQYSIDWIALSQNEDGVTIQVDTNGDGTFERTIYSDNELTREEFILKIDAIIDIDPDTLNLNSTGKWITSYIELPNGFNVSNINISTILLNETVSAEKKPIDLSDYDNDNIPDLMVKFKRQDVIDILEPGEDIEIKVSGELNDGTKFEGVDYIRVIYKN